MDRSRFQCGQEQVPVWTGVESKDGVCQDFDITLFGGPRKWETEDGVCFFSFLICGFFLLSVIHKLSC